MNEQQTNQPMTEAEKAQAITAAKQEIVEAFPECERIKKPDITNLVTEIFESVPTYHDISNKASDFCKTLWPEPQKKWDSEDRETRKKTPEYQEWHNWFYGDWDKEIYPLSTWTDLIVEKFLAINGKRHTLEEASKIAAEQWAYLIFGEVRQDNGDDSELGLFGRGLAETIKRKSMANTPQSAAVKFIQLMYDYYLGGCLFTNADGRQWKEIPYTDYGPNQSLEKILLDSGVPEKSVSGICPWKTGVTIDRRDFSVVVRKYQTSEIY